MCLEVNLKNRINMATPLIATIIFLTIGFTTGVWHPTWAVFFLIIIVPVFLYQKFTRILYPLIVTAIYITFSLIFNIWHPLWVIFLTIPVYSIIFEPFVFNKKEIKESFRKEIKKEFIDAFEKKED